MSEWEYTYMYCTWRRFLKTTKNEFIPWFPFRYGPVEARRVRLPGRRVGGGAVHGRRRGSSCHPDGEIEKNDVFYVSKCCNLVFNHSELISNSLMRHKARWYKPRSNPSLHERKFFIRSHLNSQKLNVWEFKVYHCLSLLLSSVF